ncbi:MAG: hypothetical protein ACAI44_29470 [Candidatus Sericytochromatia bacterium]
MKFQHSLLALTLALSLAACTAAPQLPLAPDTQAPAMNEPLAQLAAPEEIEDPNAYRSLVIKDDGFATKALVSKSRRAVVVTIGTSSYTLTYKFMRKLRFLMSQSPYIQADSTQALALTGFFTRMKASATTNVAASGTTTEPLFGPTNPTSVPYLYTLSTSEAAFVAKLETYQGVIMPNYLQEDETYTESTGSYNALSGTDSLRLIVNKTGVRKSFYQAIHQSLSDDFSVAGVEHLLDQEDLESPNTSALWQYNGGDPTGSLFQYDLGDGGSADITSAEKTLLNAIVAKNPTAPNVLLLDDSSNIVYGDISIYYGEQDYVEDAATGVTLTQAEDVLDNLGARTRINDTVDLSADPSKVKEPASTANLTSAAAVFGGLLRRFLGTTHIELEASEAYYNSFIGGSNVTGMPTAAEMMGTPYFSELSFEDAHRAIRSIYLMAGGATLSTNAASLPKFGTISAPAQVASPTYTAMTSTEYGQLGSYLIGGDMGLGINKIGKSTATTLKNKLGVEAFFAINTDASFLLVPTSRSSTGTLTFSATGTNWVTVFATDSGGGVYTYYVYDPAYENGSGDGFYPFTAAMQTSLFNYSGTLVGVK